MGNFTASALLNAARALHVGGFVVLPAQGKAVRLPNWQERTLADNNDAIFTEWFGNGANHNVGVSLGASGLLDLDLDCGEAMTAADFFAPPTGRVFGRASAPRSHRIYRYAGEARAEKIVDPLRLEGATIVEMRAGAQQTIFPPSIHPESGEQIVWERCDHPASIEASALRDTVRLIGVSALLGRYWAAERTRHTWALPVAGFLAWHGVEHDAARRVVKSACRIAGDEEVKDRLRVVGDTYNKLANGEPASGGPTLKRLLAERLGERDADRLFAALCGLVGPAVSSGGKQPTTLIIGATPLAGELQLTTLDTISPEPVHYLVPGRLPLGKLVLLAGDGGHGKSTLTLDLAACLTTGKPCFGLDYVAPEPCEVLLISCEDDFADTVVPRLLSAGADLSKIHRVDGVRDDKGQLLPFNLAYFKQLEVALQAHPGIRLVIIDPAGAYIGRAGVDDYKDSELRALLGPLSELSAARSVTNLLVKHFVKASVKAAHKVGGSAGYVNAVRVAYVLVPDKDEEAVKLFLPIKHNLPGPTPTGLSFRMESVSEQVKQSVLSAYAARLSIEDQEQLGQQLFRINWLGEVDTDADAALGALVQQERGAGSKIDDAADWLMIFLSEYAYPTQEILAAAEKKGLSRRTLYRARDKIDSTVYAQKRGFRGCWWWGIGSPDGWRCRPGEGAEGEA